MLIEQVTKKSLVNMSKKSPREFVKFSSSTKETYHYSNPDEGVDIKSKEIFKNQDIEIHYPFNSKNGKPKYDKIESISFIGFKRKIPAGFLKAFTRGYGFTRDLSPLVYEIQKVFPKVSKIKIVKVGKSVFSNTPEITLSESDLSNARPKIKALNSKHKDEKEKLARDILSRIFPNKIANRTSNYPKGELFRIIETYDVTANKISDEDKRAIQSLFLSISESGENLSEGDVVEAKTNIDKALTEKLVEDFEKIFSRKMETERLEDTWQDFFTDNILFLNFGYVNRFEKERILGDKAINIPDFLMLNSFSYIDIFEIKTHLTPLLTFDNGRKNFYWTSEASRAIAQAENYIDSLIKQEDTIIKNIRDEYGGIVVNAVRPSVYIIASSLESLVGKKTSSYRGKHRAKLENDYRRLNNSLKNIKFILYDELLENFKHFIKRLSEDPE